MNDELTPMWVTDFKINMGRITLNPESYCPQRHVNLDVTILLEAQHDGRWPTQDEMKQSFYKSAQPMLEQIMRTVREPEQ